MAGRADRLRRHVTSMISDLMGNATNRFCKLEKNGVLRKLKHIFPNTYRRIKSICSPAKVGLVVTDFITSPVVSWRGWETPHQHRGSAVILCMTSSEVSGAGGEPSYLFFGKY